MLVSKKKKKGGISTYVIASDRTRNILDLETVNRPAVCEDAELAAMLKGRDDNQQNAKYNKPRAAYGRRSNSSSSSI